MNEQYLIASVQKALQTLKQFDGVNKEMTLTELSNKTGINKSGMLRIISTLENEGFLTYKPDTKKYSLGISVFNLSHAFGTLDIREICRPILKEAALESRLLLHLAAIQDNKVICLDKVWATDNSDSMTLLLSFVGGAIPIHCTGVGKILVAYSNEKQQKLMIDDCPFDKRSEKTITNKDEYINLLPDIRKRGYAFNDCENEPYLRCLTRPVFNAKGECIAAVSFSGLKDVMTDSTLPYFDQISIKTMAKLNKLFGYEGPTSEPMLG